MPALIDGITFGSVTLDGLSGGNWIESLVPLRLSGSLKYRNNENVSVIPIPGRAKEWQLEISGFLSGSSRDADEQTLTDYDNGSVRLFTDGKHNGNYVILSLEFPKSNREKTYYPYRMTIRQYTQTV